MGLRTPRVCVGLLTGVLLLPAAAGARINYRRLLKDLPEAPTVEKPLMIRAIGVSRRRKAAIQLAPRLLDSALPAPQRRALVEALGQLAYREASGPLVVEWERLLGAAVSEEEGDRELQRLRGAVALAIGRTAEEGNAAALAAVRRGIHDAASEVALASIEAAGRMRDAGSIPVFAALLGGSDDLRAGAAADALGRIGGKEAERLLRERLTTGSSSGRVAAAYALARMGRRIGVLTLDGFLEEVVGPYADGIAAAGALAALEKTRGIAYLAAILNAGPGEHFFAAVRALGRSGSPRAVLPLAGLLGSPDEGVRAAAVAALGAVGGDRAAFELRRRKDDPDPALRATIRETRALLGDYVLP